jgi:uncharacterized DUF497 family protein
MPHLIVDKKCTFVHTYSVTQVRHSKTEQRLLAIGKTVSGRYAFIVFTLRSDETGQYLRPISARFMHQKEIRHYENL